MMCSAGTLHKDKFFYLARNSETLLEYNFFHAISPTFAVPRLFETNGHDRYIRIYIYIHTYIAYVNDQSKVALSVRRQKIRNVSVRLTARIQYHAMYTG